MAYEILLIESSEADRKDIGTFLESLGYGLNYANTSKDGLQQFEKLQPDLVIAEVLLSGNMNGLQVCKSIKADADWAKVIVTSKLYKSSSMARDAVDKYRADAYLEKPFQMKDLYEHIQELIGVAPLPEDSKLKGGKYQNATPLPEEEESDTLPEPPARKKKKAKKSEDRKIEKSQDEPTPKAQPEPEQIALPPEPEAPAKPEPVSQPEQAAPAPVDQPPAEPQAAAALDIDLEGEVSREHLSKLLHELFAQKVNGVLILEYPEGSKHIFTVDGLPVFVQSNIRQESLGQILLSGGHLTQEQYQTVLEEAAATKKKIGAICVRQGFLSSKELHTILTEQTAIKVANCFAWEIGRYKLDLSRTYPKNAPIFEASPAKIILLAYFEHYPMDLLESRYEQDKNKIVFAGKEDVYQGLQKELSDKHQSFLNEANGKWSLGELTEQEILGKNESIKLAYALLTMGVFKLGDVKRDKELDEYQPDSAFETDQDPNTGMLESQINEMYIRLENENHFQLIGVEHGVSKDELVGKFHYMKNQFKTDILGDQAPRAQLEKLKAINQRLDEAYNVLADPSARQSYIQSLDGKEAGENSSSSLESEVILQKAEKENPPLASELAFQKGQFAMDRGKYHAAVDYFGRACRLEPNTGDYHIRLGYAKFLLATAPREPLDAAFDNIQKGLQLAPGNVFALRALAEIERYRGNLESAADYLKRLLKTDPENDEAELELSEIQSLLAKSMGKG